MYNSIKIGFALLLNVIINSYVQAQNHAWCGTSTTPSKWTEEYLKNREAYPKSNETLYLPVTIQIVGTDAGEGYVSAKTMLDGLCKLNKDFESTGIQFYIFGEFRYINRTAYYDDKDEIYREQMHRNNRVQNTINIYIVENAGEDRDEEGNVSRILGYAVGGIGGDGLIVIKSEISSLNATLTHEMGHALGLYHTFYGWEGYEHNYALNAPELVNYNRRTERVDGSNCTDAGDGLCDTKPDYLSNGAWSCNTESLSNISQKDPAGSTFRSDGTNFMAYSQSACQNRFTNEQSQAMRANVNTAKRRMLNRMQPLSVLDSTLITLQSPLSNVAVNVAAINLSWQNLSNATAYLVEVSRVSSFVSSLTTSYLVRNNEIILSNLTSGRSYYWRVRAFNEFSFCTGFSTAGRFQATSTTPVTEIEGNGTFNVYPNLLSQNQAVTIEANVIENTALNIRLFDISGKLLQSIDYEVLAGENTLRFNPNKTSKGIYLLHITTNRGAIVERLVIQ